MAYTPTVWATGDVITAVKLNKAENGIAAASVAELPSVSDTDEGKVLTVDSSGDWVASTAASDIVYIPVTVGNDGYETTFAFADAVSLVGRKQMVLHIDASASAAAADQAHYFYYFYQMDGAALYFGNFVLDDVSGKLVPAALVWTSSGIADYPTVG